MKSSGGSSITVELAGALTLAGLVLMASIATSYVALEYPATVILSNLRPYFAGLLIVLGLGLAAVGGWKRALVLALVAAFVLIEIAATLVGNREAWMAARSLAGPRKLTVVNFNVYNRNTRNPADVASTLAAGRADVIVLLEATRLKPHLAVLRESFPFLAGCQELSDECDTIILSRHPVSDVAIRTLGPISPNRFVSARIAIGSDSVTIVAAHLTKPYFDYYGWREVRHLARLINDLPGPLLLAGDFNAAPWSHTLTLLRDRTGLVPGPVPVATWPAAVGSIGLPIDHILTRPPMVIERILPFTDNLGSNHRGLAAQIRY